MKLATIVKAASIVIMAGSVSIMAGCGGDVIAPSPPVPSATGSMAAAIDGQLCSNVSQSPPQAQLVSQGGLSSLSIVGLLFAPTGQLVGTMFLELGGPIELGSYDLTRDAINADQPGNAGWLFLESRATLWGTNETHVGVVTITRLDIAGLLVEGTFSFDGISPETGALKSVRQGTFSAPLVIAE
ncbi:MAG: hypothetical protein IPG61_16190 [bacterium]|jgi:hypothetical protein|nr:hypothetical protein [bacterium]